MAYPSHPFPPSTPLFPHARLVKDYLDDYANHFHLHPHIQLNTSVTQLKWDGSFWKVTTSTGESYRFDLVLVCNGHSRIPRYPDTPGIAEWVKSGRATHSAWYRRPHNINKSDTVLVIGGGSSANDISAEIQGIAKTVIRSITNAPRQDLGNLKIRGRVLRFEETSRVTYQDGTTDSDITHCILATGYQYSFPFLSEEFLHSGLPPPVPPLPTELYNTTSNVFPLARHLFPLQTAFPPHTLVFAGLPLKGATFSLAEAKARAALHVFANPTLLDIARESVDIIAKHERFRTEFGDDELAIWKAWRDSSLTSIESFHYRDRLADFVSAAPDFDLWERQHIKVPEWVKKFYCERLALRGAWKTLEERGEADAWVHGVGEGGTQEWVDLMGRLLQWAEENGFGVGAPGKPKL